MDKEDRRYYADPTAETAIDNADTDIKAKKVIAQVLRYLKGNGFILLNRLHIYHEKTKREYK